MEYLRGNGRALVGLLAARMALFPGVIPPWPGFNLIPAVIVPPPPMIADPTPTPEKLRFLTTTLAEGARHLTGSYNAGSSCLTKYSGLLAKAQMLLWGADIAPAVWVRWSILKGHYLENGGGVSPGWVYSSRRLLDLKLMERFHEETLGYSARRLVLVPEHRELVERHERMQKSLLTAALTREATLDVARCFFPHGLEVEPVAEIARNKQAEINRRVALGGWYWS